MFSPSRSSSAAKPTVALSAPAVTLFKEQIVKERSTKILILYTGGTMGMKPMLGGSLAPAKGYLTEQIKGLPENSRDEMPDFDIVEYDPLIDSSCMGPKHWSRIATDIQNAYMDYDGFVVIMGTDTMAYASSMLSFMLENLDKTVVFTGSQIPFAEIYNDARRNLLVSMLFAANSTFPEVVVVFNDKVMRANRTVKVNSRGLDAFHSPNYPPLADLATTIVQHRERGLPPPRERFKVHKNIESHVIVLKLVPGFDNDAIFVLIDHSTTLRGIIIEMYGSGNAPTSADEGKRTVLDAVKEARAKGVVTVAISQCLQGGVNMATYALGKEFKDSGVVSGGDMTCEACSTKMAYLFGRYQDPHIVEQLMSANIRGEISAPDA